MSDYKSGYWHKSLDPMIKEMELYAKLGMSYKMTPKSVYTLASILRVMSDLIEIDNNLIKALTSKDN